MNPSHQKTVLRKISVTSSRYKISDKKLIITNKSTIHYLNKHQVIYCQADGNYTHIHLQDGSHHISSHCLKKICTQLQNQNFYRIHARYLINLDYIRTIDKSKKEINISGKILPIARNRFKSLLDYISYRL